MRAKNADTYYNTIVTNQGELMILLTILTKASFALAVCRDGTISYSSGRGTCSWHGGIAYYTTQEELNRRSFDARVKNHTHEILKLMLEYKKEQESCWDNVYMTSYNSDQYYDCIEDIAHIANKRKKLEEEVCDISQSYFDFRTDHSQHIYREMLSNVRKNNLAYQSKLYQSSIDSLNLEPQEYAIAGMGYSYIEGTIVFLLGEIAHEYTFHPVNDYVKSDLKKAKYFVAYFLGEVDLGENMEHDIDGVGTLSYAVPAYKLTYMIDEQIKHETIIITKNSYYETYKGCFHYKDL